MRARPPQRHGHLYLLLLGGLAALFVGFGGLLVWTVDPYGALGRNSIGIYAESERQAKPGMLLASGAHTVLIGSSKVAYIDPSPLGGTAFNASFSAAMPEEIVNFLTRYVTPGSTVVIGLDPFMMNAHAYPLAPATFGTEPGPWDTLGYVFGLRPAWAAVDTMRQSIQGLPPALKANGQRDPTLRLARHATMEGRDDDAWLIYLRTHQYADFDYSTERVAAFGEILTIARERNLTLFTFINPLSDPVRALLSGLPARKDVERFRSDARKALPGIVDLSMAPGWGEPDLYFRFDPFHYLPDTGARILRTVMGRPPVYQPPANPPSFGVVRGDSYPEAPAGLTLNPALHSRAAPGALPRAIIGPPMNSSREVVQ